MTSAELFERRMRGGRLLTIVAAVMLAGVVLVSYRAAHRDDDLRHHGTQVSGTIIGYEYDGRADVAFTPAGEPTAVVESFPVGADAGRTVSMLR